MIYPSPPNKVLTPAPVAPKGISRLAPLVANGVLRGAVKGAVKGAVSGLVIFAIWSFSFSAGAVDFKRQVQQNRDTEAKSTQTRSVKIQRQQPPATSLKRRSRATTAPSATKATVSPTATSKAATTATPKATPTASPTATSKATPPTYPRRARSLAPSTAQRTATGTATGTAALPTNGSQIDLSKAPYEPTVRRSGRSRAITSGAANAAVSRAGSSAGRLGGTTGSPSRLSRPPPQLPQVGSSSGLSSSRLPQAGSTRGAVSAREAASTRGASSVGSPRGASADISTGSSRGGASGFSGGASAGLAGSDSSPWEELGEEIGEELGKETGDGIGGSSQARGDGSQASPQASSQASQQLTFSVSGNYIISEDEVLAFAGFGKDGSVNKASITEAVKRLFESNYFADVNIYVDRNVVYIELVENPLVNDVIFIGNEEIETDTLKNEVNIRPRQIYSQQAVESSVARLRNVYRRTGRFSSTVEGKIKELPDNRLNVVFDIDERATATIKGISFLGNKRYSASELEEVILSRTESIYYLFGSADVYDPDRITYDGELLRRFYFSKGYADFDLLSTTTEISEDGESIYITYTIEEGDRYKVANSNIISEVKNIEAEPLKQFIETEANEWYSADDVDASMDNIKAELALNGYAFVQISPRIKRLEEPQRIEVNYLLTQANKVFVRNIKVSGNFHTLDQVVLRELTLNEGDPFDINRIRRSRRNLEALGIFQNVNIQTINTEDPTRVDLNVAVQEMPTGELMLGTGYSTADGVLGNIRLRERNFLGRGQDISIGTSLSQRTNTFDVGAVIPYIFDRRLTGSGRLYHITRDYKTERGYTETESGGTVAASYYLGENLAHTLRYTLYSSETKFTSGLFTTTRRYLQQERGNFLHSIIGNELRYDTRDSYYNPTEGVSLTGYFDYSGLGGDVDYFSLITINRFYYTMVPLWTSSFTLRTGYIEGLGGQQVRLSDHFDLGDRTFRGFQIAGLGPRDSSSNIALGGTKYYVGQLEQQFPIGLPPELEINGRAFLDVGSLWDADITLDKKYLKDENTLRATTGLGMAWRSPFGGVRIYFAKVLKKQSYDKTESIIFSFGSNF